MPMTAAAPASRPATTDPLLEVAGLRVEIATERGVVRAVRDVSFDLTAGETLAIVGESGSGKSVTALSLLGLMRGKSMKVTAGRLAFGGRDLLVQREAAMRRIRGGEIGMIFQDPMTSLNPVLTVGRQLSETAETHLGMGRAAARRHAAELLDLVGIPSASARLDDYPHQFSGGMRQRVMIAMAISCRPKLLIADEPTTALDVTIQAQILELLARLQAEFAMAVILVTHDLGVVARVADRMLVMYAGRVVEIGSAEQVFEAPQMPYTRGLLASVPRLDVAEDRPIAPIPGNPPSAMRRVPGCSFAPRCPHAEAACREGLPPLARCGPGHHAACLFAGSFGAVGARR